MKAVSILAVLLLLAVNAAALPQAAAYRPPAFMPYLADVPYVSVVLAVIALLAILTTRTRIVQVAEAPPVEAARPAAPPPPPANQAEAEVVSFLATLQAKGRFVDFLMEDVNAAPDAQVGAAARVVHAGCRAALLEHFRISPIRDEKEGATVQVPAGYAADEYRLLGRVAGQPPFSGVLVHHGWKTDSVTLPRILAGPPDRLPTVAPAEVELR